MPNELPEKMTELSGDIASSLRKNYLNVFRKGLVEYTEGNKILRAQRYKIKSKKRNSLKQKSADIDLKFK